MYTVQEILHVFLLFFGFRSGLLDATFSVLTAMAMDASVAQRLFVRGRQWSE